MRVHGGLYCLRIITRKYEFRSDDEGAPLADILAATFPPLLATLQGLLASPSASTDVAVCLKLARGRPRAPSLRAPRCTQPPFPSNTNPLKLSMGNQASKPLERPAQNPSKSLKDPSPTPS